MSIIEEVLQAEAEAATRIEGAKHEAAAKLTEAKQTAAAAVKTKEHALMKETAELIERYGAELQKKADTVVAEADTRAQAFAGQFSKHAPKLKAIILETLKK